MLPFNLKYRLEKTILKSCSFAHPWYVFTMYLIFARMESGDVKVLLCFHLTDISMGGTGLLS